MIHSSNLRGIICMVLCAFTLVTNDSFLKVMVAEIAPLQSLFLRGLVATVWCFILVVVLGHSNKIHLAFAPWTLARSLAEVFAVCSFIIALAHVPLAELSAIYQIAPLMVLAGASVVWAEKIGLSRWLLICVGLLGAVLVAQPGAAGASPYALLGLITALGSALRDLMSRKVPDRAPGMVITLCIVVLVMLVAGIGTVLFEDWKPVTWPVAGYALGAGLFLVLGQFFAFMAFRLATARAVAPFYYFITLFAMAYGIVLFNEVPNTVAMIGIGLIISCGIGVLFLEKRGATS